LAWYSAASARRTSESSVSTAASSDTPPLKVIGITLSWCTSGWRLSRFCRRWPVETPPWSAVSGNTISDSSPP